MGNREERAAQVEGAEPETRVSTFVARRNFIQYLFPSRAEVVMPIIYDGKFSVARRTILIFH